MTAASDRPSRAGELLLAVHRTPGVARAELAERLGLSSGGASDLVAALVRGRQLSEGEPTPTGGRGRPTRALWPHPEGPLVAVAAIFHERWRVEVCELGGRAIDATSAPHDRDAGAVLEAIGGALTAAWSAHGSRLRALAISAPGTVSGTRLVQASGLGWEDLDLARLRPAAAGAADLPVRAGNDATFTALGELARGAAHGHASSLHLFMESGVGGALIDGGRLSGGAHGMAGEFGHLPLGASRRRCRCGALGCWNTELDGAALARRLGRPVPDDEVTFARRVLAAAAQRPGPERRAAVATARAFGRGAAGLVNACDPELVVLSGLAADLLAVAPQAVDRAYRAGLMSTRATAPPALVAGALGGRGPLVGAMETAFAPVLAHPQL